MKLAVIGSRGFNDFELLRMELDQMSISEIISGGAKGADSLAKQYAEMRNISIVQPNITKEAIQSLNQTLTPPDHLVIK